MHSLKRLWGLSGLLFCLALSGCGLRKEIRISGAEPVSSAVDQAAGPKENLPKTGDTTNILLPSALLAVAAACFVYVIRRRKKH